MEEFLQLPWNPEVDCGNTWVLDDTSLKKYSSTYKILQGNLQPVFSSDSASETDDVNNHNTPKSDLKEENEYINHPVTRNTSRKFKQSSWKNSAGCRQYVPCFSDERKIKYPKCSSLSAEEQALYLHLMMKFTKQHSAFLSPVERKEMQQYERLNDKVTVERFEFINFVKQRCALTQDRYLVINPDVKKYIEEKWQCCLSDVNKYPSCYEPLRMLPIVYSDIKKPIVMKMEEHLLEIGEIPSISIPKFKTPVHISSDCSRLKIRMSLFKPNNKQSLYKIPVSDDPNAEQLAISSGAEIVISSSGLKHIVDNHPPSFDKSWDLPIVVKEYKQKENKHPKKIVYVDKVLPPRNLTTAEKNLWFHKAAVKLLLCKTRYKTPMRVNAGRPCMNQFSFKNNTGSANTANKMDLSDTNSWETTSCSDAESILSRTESKTLNNEVLSAEISNVAVVSPENTLKRKYGDDYSDDECEESDITDTDTRLVIDCSDSDRSVRKKNTPIRSGGKRNLRSGKHVEEQSRVTRSKARLIAKMSSINKSLGQKPIKITVNNSGEYSQTSTLEKSLNDLKLYSDNNIHSEVPKSASKNFNDNNKTRIPITNKNLRSQKKHSVVKSQKSTKNKWIPPSPNSSVSYSLWKLGKNETQKDDLKDNFLKGDTSTREIKVLVRCKTDGHEMIDNEVHKECVVAKMEYQTEYGAECLTQSELTQQWLSLFIRPGATLRRVRVNACTSEVMMIEHRSLSEVAQESIRQLGRPNSVTFGTLYNILVGLVDLEPGNYLLSHTPKLGAFVNLQHCVGNGRINLHDIYNIDPKAAPTNEKSLWIAIDNNVVTPFHSSYKRVPGTFPPGKNVPNKKKYKRKKKKKSN